jgi:phosphoribosyl-AMP cyclohydrolase
MDIPATIAARFEKSELIAAIAQDAISGEVLMLAWMNQEAFEETIRTQNVTYWSRSRNQLWIKGESSGHTQKLIGAMYDCDGDALLLQVSQNGAACHTGERSCFFSEIELVE